MKKILQIMLGVLIALILGSGLGIGTAIIAYDGISSLHSVQNGPWQTNLSAGSGQASPYLRASIAVHGLLALNQSETIYYHAYKDDSGQPFNGDSVYRIEGRPPDARWWSITLYGEDDFLIPNELKRYSYSGNNVTYNSDGKFTIFISKKQQTGNWLPLGDHKKFSLSLRLYNPGYSIRNNPGSVELPHIIREVNK